MFEWSVPEAFAARREAVAGNTGKQWIESLPRVVDVLSARWNLTVDGEAMHGEKALVLPVLRDSKQLVLKVSWIERSTMDEAVALLAWQGNGSIKLYERDVELGALLLERADSSRTLLSIDVDEAARVGGELLRRLAVPAPPVTFTLHDFCNRFADGFERRWKACGQPFPRRALDTALVMVLTSEVRESRLVNWDLHYDNVLAAGREPWLVIDPMVIAGDPEYGVFPLILRLPRVDTGLMRRAFDIVAEAGEFDPDVARKWVFVRTVDYWLWALETGLTEDPKICDVMLGEFH